MRVHQDLSTVLRETAALLPAGSPPVTTVVRRGRRIRRRRRVTRALLCFVLAPGALVLGVRFLPVPDGVSPLLGQRTVKPASPVPSSPGPRGAVRVVTPGEEIPVGRIGKVTLSADGRLNVVYDGDGGTSKRWSLDHRDVDEGVGAQKVGRPGERILAGVCHGDDVAKVAVSFGPSGQGETQYAQVLTLSGRPGWAAFFLDEPVSSSWPGRVTCFGADGRALAGPGIALSDTTSP